jgi:hypothetical protein
VHRSFTMPCSWNSVRVWLGYLVGQSRASRSVSLDLEHRHVDNTWHGGSSTARGRGCRPFSPMPCIVCGLWSLLYFSPKATPHHTWPFSSIAIKPTGVFSCVHVRTVSRSSSLARSRTHVSTTFQVSDSIFISLVDTMRIKCAFSVIPMPAW